MGIIAIVEVVMSAKLRSDSESIRQRSPGNETILLLENADGLRETIQNILQRNGYFVLPARHRDEAVGFGNQHPGTIDLLLTDVRLLQKDNGHLLENRSSRKNHMKVLCICDHPQDVERFRPEAGYLERPLKLRTLLAKIRSVLDE